MGEWTILDYVELTGRNQIREWLDELPPKDQAKIDERRGRWNSSEKCASKYEGTDEIYEFRITSNKIQYRPLGTYHGRRQYVVLAGAIERNGKIPKRNIETAKRRPNNIRSSTGAVITHQFEGKGDLEEIAE